MFRQTIYLALFLFAVNTYAQTNLDSLYTIWEDRTQPDSTRVFAFSDYIWDGFIYSNPDTTLILANQLLDFSTTKNHKKGVTDALNIQGIAHETKSNYVLSLQSHNKGLRLSEEQGDLNGVARSLSNIAHIYYNQGYFSKAIDYLTRSLKINEERGDKDGASGSLGNIGVIYSELGDNVKALEYYLKSLKIYEEIGDQDGISNNLANIGTIYLELGDSSKAMDYLSRSQIINEEISDKEGLATVLAKIGLIHKANGDSIKALDNYQRSLRISEEIENKTGISVNLRYISIYHLNRGDLNVAMDYIKRSLEIDLEIGDKTGQAECLNLIGQIYFKQRDYSKAIDNCNKGLNLGLEIGAISLQKESCDCLFKSYKALGDGNKALGYIEQMNVLTDSMQTQETAKQLQQMEFSKQVLADSLVQVEKERKVEVSHQVEIRQKDKNRNIAIGAGLFFLLLAAGFYGRWRFVKKSKAIVEKEKKRSDNLLLNILPAEIAEELKITGKADARDFDLVSILFTDFKSFTETSEKITAKELIGEINHCFEAFDHICEKYGIEKIKTIGDAYMAAGGLPVPTVDSIKNTVLASLEMQAFITERIKEKHAKNEIPFEMRLGIHTGPVVAGIVGIKKFQYDIWGDTVNTASRMESSGEIGTVNISQSTYELIKDDSDFSFEARGKIEVKGKGELTMYFVSKI